MSQLVRCPHCGQLYQIPAAPGDGAYGTAHICNQTTQPKGE